MLAKWPIVRRARYAKVYISLQRCRKMSFLEGDVHGWLGRAAKRGFDNKKAPNTGSFLNLNGGGGGIRTLVTLYRPNGFRDRRIQPLCHPSAGAMRRLKGRHIKTSLEEARGISLAERWGFEPQIRFWRIHDFQSCSLSQTRTSLLV